MKNIEMKILEKSSFDNYSSWSTDIIIQFNSNFELNIAMHEQTDTSTNIVVSKTFKQVFIKCSSFEKMQNIILDCINQENIPVLDKELYMDDEEIYYFTDSMRVKDIYNTSYSTPISKIIEILSKIKNCD